MRKTSCQSSKLDTRITWVPRCRFAKGQHNLAMHLTSKKIVWQNKQVCPGEPKQKKIMKKKPQLLWYEVYASCIWLKAKCTLHCLEVKYLSEWSMYFTIEVNMLCLNSTVRHMVQPLCKILEMYYFISFPFSSVSLSLFHCTLCTHKTLKPTMSKGCLPTSSFSLYINRLVSSQFARCHTGAPKEISFVCID